MCIRDRDKDTEGLLLLTNDGVWGHSIINGHKHVPKVYYVEFEGELSEEGDVYKRQTL